MEPQHSEDCRRDPEVQVILDREAETFCGRHSSELSRLIEAGREVLYTPGNVQRVLHNASRQFKIDPEHGRSDLH
jgi:hypothetical protein